MPSSKRSMILNPAKILLVDDHPSVREGLAARISTEVDLVVCGEAAEVGEALRQFELTNPDVVIVDLSLRDGDGLDLIKRLVARRERVRTIVHSMYDDAMYAQRCLRAGAMGYVNKGASSLEVLTAIRQVLEGRIYLSDELSRRLLQQTVGMNRHASSDPIDTLTDRQLQVFRLLGEGLTTSQIARSMHISPHTVETHRENIKRKLQIDNVTALTRLAAEWVLKQGK